jgi:hypothetical protein
MVKPGVLTLTDERSVIAIFPIPPDNILEVRGSTHNAQQDACSATWILSNRGGCMADCLLDHCKAYLA